jgi:hypothetical protein
MPKGIYELFTTDADLERNGFALEYGSSTFVVARAGGANKKFQSVLERKMRPYRSAINSGTMDETVAEKLLAEAYAEAIILAWDGVTEPEPDEDGLPVEIPFTKDNIVRVLLDLPDLFRDIQEQSQKVANFLKDAVEEDAKL